MRGTSRFFPQPTAPYSMTIIQRTAMEVPTRLPSPLSGTGLVAPVTITNLESRELDTKKQISNKKTVFSPLVFPEDHLEI